MRWVRVLATSFLLTAPADAGAVGDGGTAVIDRPSGFGALPFDGISDSTLGTRMISADGCYVVFASKNDVLLPNDENDATNVYRKDRCSPGHPLEQVNVSSTGAQPEPQREAISPSISANGRYVAFLSDAPSLSPDANGARLVWRKDMDTGDVELASVGEAGQKGGQPSGPVISGDGTHIAFAQDGFFDAANTDGQSGQTNVYVRDLTADHTYVASVKASDGSAGGGANGSFDINFDGTAVAFASVAQLAAADADSGTDAYLARSIGPSPTQTLVSYTIGNTSGAQSASEVALSTNGTWVLWSNSHPWVTTCTPGCTAASNLDFGLDSSVTDGQAVTAPSFGYSMSGASPTTPSHAFWTTSAPLTAGDTNNYFDAYAHSLADLTASGLSRMSDGTDPAGVFESRASDDATLLMLRSNSAVWPGNNGACCQVFLKSPGGVENLSQPEGAPLHVPEAASVSLHVLHSLSANGRYSTFTSAAPGLGVPFLDNDEYRDQIFRRDMLTGETTPVSVADDGHFGDNFAFASSIDATGDRVAFVSHATDLVPGATNGQDHLYVRDLATGTTKLLDRTAGGQPSTDGVAIPKISGDGRTVVFLSNSPDLPEAPATGRHAYAVDVDSGAITLVDRSEQGAAANNNADGVDASADGNRVAFVSDAGNLGGAASGYRAVYVKDRSSGAVTWVSRPQDGNTTLHDAGQQVSISADGQRVAFIFTDDQFGFGSNGVPHVFLRDLGAATTTIASLGTGQGLNGEQGGPALSGDGRRMTFWEASYPGHPERIYFRDLETGATTALENGPNGASNGNIDPTGTCAAFTASATGLADPGYPSADYEHAYVRAFGGDCPPVPPPGGGPGAGGTADTTAPVISAVKVTNKRFRLGTKRTALTAKRAKRGTTFVLTLSEAARTTIAIAQRLPGRKKGTKCVKPRKGLKKRCTRYVARLTLTRSKAVQGANRVAYSGRTSKGKLKPGRYRATLRATDAAGNRSRAKNVSFTIVRR